MHNLWLTLTCDDTDFPIHNCFLLKAQITFILTFSLDCSEAFGPKITENIPGTPMEPDESYINDKRNCDNVSNQSTTIVNESERRLSNERMKPTTPVKDSSYQNHSNNLNHSTNNMLSSYADKFSSQRTSTSDFDTDIRRTSKQDKEVDFQLATFVTSIRTVFIKGADPESLMFRDGRRKIDIVLSYEEENEGVMTEQESKRREFRKIFLENLAKEGLELELEDKLQAYDEKTFFVKIHMPWRTETRYTEVLNLKLPVKRFITISVKAWVKCLIALFVVVFIVLYSS